MLLRELTIDPVGVAKSLPGEWLWCTVRHARPDVVIETGVAHGISSRVLLEALSQRARAPVEHRPPASAQA
jgi:hypothetical protein